MQAGITGADAPRVEGVAPLPRRNAHRLIGHDHTVPAVTSDLADPFDDPAPPPPATGTHPHSGVARGGAAFFPGDARAHAARVGDRLAHLAQYANLCPTQLSRSRPAKAHDHAGSTAQEDISLRSRSCALQVIGRSGCAQVTVNVPWFCLP